MVDGKVFETIREECLVGCYPELIRIDTRAAEIAQPEEFPRVGVLMSTYNGERFLEEQIESIANQEGVEITLFVRDDGSADDTKSLLANLENRRFGCISSCQVEYGNNVGFLASFERLIATASGCDYYAFSDQDDFWLPGKTAHAIGAMRDTNAGLYASAVEITDEGLKPVGRNSFPGLAYTIPAELIRHRLAGHTMVWKDSLQQSLSIYSNLPCWSHDQHIAIAGLMSGGNLVFDEASYVLHRRLATSVTPGGAGFAKRLRHELKMLWNPGHTWDRAALAQAILSLPGVDLAVDDARFLNKCAAHRRFSLAGDSAFDCGLAVGNVEAQVSVLMGRF